MTRSRVTLFVAAALCLPAVARGQSSQFGIRGLGLPGRGLSTRATGMGGANGLFDPRSARAVAPITQFDGLVTGFQTQQEWRNISNPAGTGNIRNNRFPLFRITGPVKRFRVWLVASANTYVNSDFGVVTSDSVSVRGSQVGVIDTLVSLGGLNDLRFGAGYELNRRWSVGAALHVITGSTRNRIRRVFGDSAFRSFRDSSEISFDGIGLSVSVTGRLSRKLSVALLLRSDGNGNVTIDSADVGQVDLPFTVAAGFEWRPSNRLTLATQGTFRSWSGINSDILSRGGVGAVNTLAAEFGGEWLRGSLPIRFGVHWRELPFPLFPGVKPREIGVSLGTGLTFAQNRAAFDISGEYVDRRQGPDWTETSWVLTAGVEVRP